MSSLVKLEEQHLKLYFPGLTSDQLEKIQMTKRSIYECTPLDVSREIAKLIKTIFGDRPKIVESCASIGGNTLGFILEIPEAQVISYEFLIVTFVCLLRNIRALGNFPNFKTQRASFLDKNDKGDALFFDPPFGDETISGHALDTGDGKKPAMELLPDFCERFKLVLFKHSKRVEPGFEKKLPAEIKTTTINVFKKKPASKTELIPSFNLLLLTTDDSVYAKFDRLPKKIIGAPLAVKLVMKKYGVDFDHD